MKKLWILVAAGITYACASAGGGNSDAPYQVDTYDQAQTTIRAYKIGETGPAGGIIFYDKGNNYNGWRYLEAAPENSEFQAVWSALDAFVENTQESIGSGKNNTMLIVETFIQIEEECETAAQKANDLAVNGYKDWFLPSKAELEQMYANLKRKDLGGFKNEWYWSSTNSDERYADTQNFRNGQMGNNYWNPCGEKSVYQNYVRPIRQVSGPEGTVRSSSGFLGNNRFLKTILGVLLMGGIAALMIFAK